jgi:hypothetical protein
MIRDVHPGCGSWFLPIPDPGSRGQKGTGSRIRIRNTVGNHYLTLILPPRPRIQKNVGLPRFGNCSDQTFSQWRKQMLGHLQYVSHLKLQLYYIGISPGIKLTTPSLIDSTRILVDFPFFSGRAALTTGLATATEITGLDQSKLLCTISYQVLNVIPKISVADPGSWILSIPDPGSKNSNKREGWKKN